MRQYGRVQWIRQWWQKFRAEHELGWEFKLVAVAAVVFVATVLLEFVVVNLFTEWLILLSGIPLLLATLYRIVANLKPPRLGGGPSFKSPRERMADELTRSAHPATKPTRR